MIKLIDKLMAKKTGAEHLSDSEYQELASELKQKLREYVNSLCEDMTFLREEPLAHMAAHKIFERMAEDWDLSEAYKADPEAWNLNAPEKVAAKMQADVMDDFKIARLLLRVAEFGYDGAI